MPGIQFGMNTIPILMHCYCSRLLPVVLWLVIKISRKKTIVFICNNLFSRNNTLFNKLNFHYSFFSTQKLWNVSLKTKKIRQVRVFTQWYVVIQFNCIFSTVYSPLNKIGCSNKVTYERILSNLGEQGKKSKCRGLGTLHRHQRRATVSGGILPWSHWLIFLKKHTFGYIFPENRFIWSIAFPQFFCIA